MLLTTTSILALLQDLISLDLTHVFQGLRRFHAKFAKLLQVHHDCHRFSFSMTVLWLFEVHRQLYQRFHEAARG